MRPVLVLLITVLIITAIAGLGVIVALIVVPKFLKKQAKTYRLYGDPTTAEKEPEAYENLKTARREILRDNFKIMTWYGIYFLVAVPNIVHYFKGIRYGPNLPYVLFLLAVGIPFLICFIHVVSKADMQRSRLLATGANRKESSKFVINWILILPAVYVTEVQFLYKISNSLFRQ